MGKPTKNKLKILLMAPITSLMNGVPAFPDVGLGYLATAIKKAGYDVYLRSWNMDSSVKNFKKFIKENKFDLIGLKVFTKDLFAANQTIKIIRALLPETVIVAGGPHPSTSEPEDVMIDFPDIDFAFRGEAEIGLPILIQYINGEKHQDILGNIPGLLWKDSNMLRSNPPLFIPDIDSFDTPLWEKMEPKDYYRAPKLPGGSPNGYSAPMMVTRGCPSNCTYCVAYKLNGKKVRTRSVTGVLEEINLLYHKYGMRHLFFLDTRFTHSIDVVTGICEGILRNKMDIAWDCIGYENLDYLTKDMLNLMKRAGCKFLSMGIESGSNRIRKIIKKRGTTEEIFEKVKMIKDVGIGVNAFFMIGFPDETRKDIEDTINYAFSLPADTVKFEIACPYPGTELLKYLKEKHNVTRIDWETFNVYKSPYPLSEVDSSELYRILKKIRRRQLFVSLKRKYLPL